jgi:hypothetical protein
MPTAPACAPEGVSHTLAADPDWPAADESFSARARWAAILAVFEPKAAAFLSFLVGFASAHGDLKRICQFLAFLASHLLRNQYGIAAIGLSKEPKKVIRDVSYDGASRGNDIWIILSSSS